MVERIVDLELWSKPCSSITLQDGHAVAALCQSSMNIAENIVLGLSFTPDDTDVQNLQFAIANEEATFDDFASFCAEQDLDTDVQNPLSASRFLAYLQGQPLAWLHFPENQTGYQMAHDLLDWAENNGFNIMQRQGETAFSATDLQDLWPR